jgi:hypothetical protein
MGSTLSYSVTPTSLFPGVYTEALPQLFGFVGSRYPRNECGLYCRKRLAEAQIGFREDYTLIKQARLPFS